MSKGKALFLDRDGVINIDHGYVIDKHKFDFVDGIFDLCRHYQLHGFKIFVVTNQSGIARGFYRESDFNNLSQWMVEKFRQQGVVINDVFYCPHHIQGTVAAYQKDCECRKPKPGMLIKAFEQYAIDPSQSVMIGDKLTDMQAAQAAKIATRYLLSDSHSTTQSHPDFTHIKHLSEARI